MPAMRTDLGFGGLTTPSGYWNEMVMGGGEQQPLEEVAPSNYVPGSTYIPPEQAAQPTGGDPYAQPYAEPVAAPTPEPQPVYMDQSVRPVQDPYGAM